MIYALAEEDDRSVVKIGYTSTPNESVNYDAARTRLSSLQTGAWRDLVCIAAAPGSRIEEARLHEEFDHYHVRGEWFLNHCEVRAWVRRWAIAPMSSNIRAMTKKREERKPWAFLPKSVARRFGVIITA